MEIYVLSIYLNKYVVKGIARFGILESTLFEIFTVDINLDRRINFIYKYVCNSGGHLVRDD